MHLARDADFVAAHTVYRSLGGNFRRLFRLALDVIAIGPPRSGSSNRYGGEFRLRFGPAWHWRGTLDALIRLRAQHAQP